MNTNQQTAKGLKVKTNVTAGGLRTNHNQTVAVDEPNVIADLPLSDEQADATKGGFKVRNEILVMNGQTTTTANTHTGTTIVNEGTLSMNYQRKSGEVQ